MGMKNTIWKLWYGNFLLEELRGSKYVANKEQMREYVESLKENWSEFAEKRDEQFAITEEQI